MNQPHIQNTRAPSNGLAIAGFVLGLLGLVFFWFPIVGVILAVLGVILSAVAMANAKKSGAGSGLAVAGLVCGLVALIPLIIIIIAAGSVTIR